MQTRTDDEVVAEEGEAEKGLVIERRFTTAGADPFDAFDWIEMSVEIRNPDGSLAHEIHGVKLPSGFAGVPGKVCAQKYLRKAGVPAALRKVAKVTQDIPTDDEHESDKDSSESEEGDEE